MSADHTLVAFMLDTQGTEEFHVRVHEIQSGKHIGTPVSFVPAVAHLSLTRCLRSPLHLPYRIRLRLSDDSPRVQHGVGI